VGNGRWGVKVVVWVPNGNMAIYGYMVVGYLLFNGRWGVKLVICG
jgi:hypothetical protein